MIDIPPLTTPEEAKRRLFMADKPPKKTKIKNEANKNKNKNKRR